MYNILYHGQIIGIPVNSLEQAYDYMTQRYGGAYEPDEVFLEETLPYSHAIVYTNRRGSTCTQYTFSAQAAHILAINTLRRRVTLVSAVVVNLTTGIVEKTYVKE